MNPPCLVTGASGLVGGAVVRRLEGSRRVLALDLAPPSPAAGDAETLAADIREPLPDRPDVEGPDVVHAAALMKADEDDLWRTNVDGTRHVLDWAVRRGARRVVFFSTGGVYGYRDTPADEDSPLDPVGYYGHTKWLGEHTCRMYARLCGLTVTVVRLFFPYGPGQRTGVFQFIHDAVRDEKTIRIHADGAPRMNPVHADDVADAVERILLRAGAGDLYNVCGDETVGFLDVVRMFEQHLGKRASCVPTDEPAGNLVGSSARAKRDLDWRPRRTLADLPAALAREEE